MVRALIKQVFGISRDASDKVSAARAAGYRFESRMRAIRSEGFRIADGISRRAVGNSSRSRRIRTSPPRAFVWRGFSESRTAIHDVTR